MRRHLLAALLVLPGSAGAQVARVTLETPLTPVTGAPNAILPATVSMPALPSAFTLNAPLSASALVTPVPVSAAAAVTPLATKTFKPAAFSAMAGIKRFVPTSAAPAIRPDATRTVIESLRLHGAESSQVAAFKGEAGSVAAERNFLSAAGLDEGGGTTGGEPLAQNDDGARRADLRDRLLKRVTLADNGKPEEREALIRVLEHMLVSPTAQSFAESFIADNLSAVIGFQDMPGSLLYDQDGIKRFSGTRGLTGWNREKGLAEVYLNRNYLQADASLFNEDLPAILAHELLGHGRWYGRMGPLNLAEGYATHEIHEQQARGLGWIVDYELDRKFADGGAWQYLQDPGNYLSTIRMQIPVYATMLSSAEMGDPLKAYQSRLALAAESVSRAERNLTNHRSWYSVIDYFIAKRGVKAERFATLRAEMAQMDEVYKQRIEVAQSVTATLQNAIKFLQSADGAQYEAYLKQVAAHPYMDLMIQESDQLGAALQQIVKDFPPIVAESAANASPDAPKSDPSAHISWAEFMKMYEQDRVDDRKRPRFLRHWTD